MEYPDYQLVKMCLGPPRAMKNFLPYMDIKTNEIKSVLPIGRIDREELGMVFDGEKGKAE